MLLTTICSPYSEVWHSIINYKNLVLKINSNFYLNNQYLPNYFKWERCKTDIKQCLSYL